MAEELQLRNPWLVAVWPGMGHVALNAGVYLLSKLEMTAIAEYEAGGLFDVDHVDVKDGMIRMGRLPRNRFFLWSDPRHERDLVVFVGEAQPPLGKLSFCRQIIGYAKQMGVERVFTFAAMATGMHPEHPSRVFGAATDAGSLGELQRLELEILEGGNISGLNGVLLGAAAESELPGTCLLGEVPQLFAQFPFPKASLAILQVFATMAGIELDFTQLAEQSRAVEEHFGELLARVEETYGEQYPAEEEVYLAEPEEEERLSPSDARRIETLFDQAEQDRSKAFELKQELDRLGVFKDFEDRFLDLFKKSR